MRSWRSRRTIVAASGIARISVNPSPASAAYRNALPTAETALPMSVIGFGTVSTYRASPILIGTAART